MLRRFIVITILAIAVAVLPIQANAQEEGDVSVVVIPDRRELTVGDIVTFTVEVNHPTGSTVTVARLDTDWGPFEVRSQSLPVLTNNADGTHTTTQTIEATLFETGDFSTPELPVTVRRSDGDLVDTVALPVTLTVASVLVDGDDTLRDIRPQAEIPVPSLIEAAVQEPVYWARRPITWIVAATLVLVIALICILVQRRSARRSTASGLDLRSPHEIAVDELDGIEGLGLPEEGRFKEHYTLVTDCLRVYVQRLVGIPAADLTTDELDLALRYSRIGKDHSSWLIELLRDADLVKFANSTPEITQAYEASGQARYIVDLLKPAPPPVAVNGAGTAKAVRS